MPDLETGKPYHEDLSFEFSANYDTLKLYNKAIVAALGQMLDRGESSERYTRASSWTCSFGTESNG